MQNCRWGCRRGLGWSTQDAATCNQYHTIPELIDNIKLADARGSDSEPWRPAQEMLLQAFCPAAAEYSVFTAGNSCNDQSADVVRSPKAVFLLQVSFTHCSTNKSLQD
jgi:hypothetical protein